MPTISKATRDSYGMLPAFAWPGGYPLYYILADGETMCVLCANGMNDSDASPDAEDPQWRIVGYEIHWEGEPLVCAHCRTEIHSAYGIPESN